MTYAHLLTGTCKCGQSHDNSTSIHTFILSNNVRTIAKVYDYEDAQGNVVHQTVRYEPKSFRQRRPDPEKPGAWLWNLQNITPVLYHLPALLANPDRTVFLVEGEKDVDSLAALGLLATCNPMGAGKWRPSYTEALAHRHVVIIPDADVAGAKHATLVSDALEDHARSALTLNLPESDKPGIHIKDVTNWIAQGGTRDDLEALVKAARARNAKPPRIMSLAKLLQREFAEPLQIVPGIVQEGSMLFTGRPKGGKSWTVLHFSIAVALGGVVFGQLHTAGGDVLHLALEDGPRLLQRRFRKLLLQGAIPERLDVATEWPALDNGGLTLIEDWLKTHKEARMVVIDTLAAIRGRDDTKQSAYRQDYDAVAPLTALAHRFNVAVVIVHHTRKMEAVDVFDTVSGTTGLTGAVDAIAVLTRKRFDNEATLSITGRDIEEHEMGLLWDAQLCQWSSAGDAEEMRQSQTQKHILAALSESDESMSVKDIADMSNLDAGVVRQRCFHMVKGGLLKKTSYGKYEKCRNTRNTRNSTLVDDFPSRNTDRNTDDPDGTGVTSECYDDFPAEGRPYQRETPPSVTSVTTDDEILF